MCFISTPFQAEEDDAFIQLYSNGAALPHSVKKLTMRNAVSAKLAKKQVIL
jgi:hypothetical protein